MKRAEIRWYAFRPPDKRRPVLLMTRATAQISSTRIVELPLSAGDGASPDPTVVGDELRLLWIIEQVRPQRIGVGKGAELAGLPRAAFMQALGVHGVPVIDYAPSDLQRELDAQDAV